MSLPRQRKLENNIRRLRSECKQLNTRLLIGQRTERVGVITRLLGLTQEKNIDDGHGNSEANDVIEFLTVECGNTEKHEEDDFGDETENRHDKKRSTHFCWITVACKVGEALINIEMPENKVVRRKSDVGGLLTSLKRREFLDLFGNILREANQDSIKVPLKWVWRIIATLLKSEGLGHLYQPVILRILRSATGKDFYKGFSDEELQDVIDCYMKMMSESEFPCENLLKMLKPAHEQLIHQNPPALYDLIFSFEKYSSDKLCRGNWSVKASLAVIQNALEIWIQLLRNGGYIYRNLLIGSENKFFQKLCSVFDSSNLEVEFERSAAELLNFLMTMRYPNHVSVSEGMDYDNFSKNNILDTMFQGFVQKLSTATRKRGDSMVAPSAELFARVCIQCFRNQVSPLEDEDESPPSAKRSRIASESDVKPTLHSVLNHILSISSNGACNPIPWFTAVKCFAVDFCEAFSKDDQAALSQFFVTYLGSNRSSEITNGLLAIVEKCVMKSGQEFGWKSGCLTELVHFLLRFLLNHELRHRSSLALVSLINQNMLTKNQLTRVGDTLLSSLLPMVEEVSESLHKLLIAFIVNAEFDEHAQVSSMQDYSSVMSIDSSGLGERQEVEKLCCKYSFRVSVATALLSRFPHVDIPLTAQTFYLLSLYVPTLPPQTGNLSDVHDKTLYPWKEAEEFVELIVFPRIPENPLPTHTVDDEEKERVKLIPFLPHILVQLISHLLDFKNKDISQEDLVNYWCLISTFFLLAHQQNDDHSLCMEAFGVEDSDGFFNRFVNKICNQWGDNKNFIEKLATAMKESYKSIQVWDNGNFSHRGKNFLERIVDVLATHLPKERQVDTPPPNQDSLDIDGEQLFNLGNTQPQSNTISAPKIITADFDEGSKTIFEFLVWLSAVSDDIGQNTVAKTLIPIHTLEQAFLICSTANSLLNHPKDEENRIPEMILEVLNASVSVENSLESGTVEMVLKTVEMLALKLKPSKQNRDQILEILNKLWELWCPSRLINARYYESQVMCNCSAWESWLQCFMALSNHHPDIMTEIFEDGYSLWDSLFLLWRSMIPKISFRFLENIFKLSASDEHLLALMRNMVDDIQRVEEKKKDERKYRESQFVYMVLQAMKIGSPDIALQAFLHLIVDNLMDLRQADKMFAKVFDGGLEGILERNVVRIVWRRYAMVADQDSSFFKSWPISDIARKYPHSFIPFVEETELTKLKQWKEKGKLTTDEFSRILGTGLILKLRRGTGLADVMTIVSDYVDKHDNKNKLISSCFPIVVGRLLLRIQSRLNHIDDDFYITEGEFRQAMDWFLEQLQFQNFGNAVFSISSDTLEILLNEFLVGISQEFQSNLTAKLSFFYKEVSGVAVKTPCVLHFFIYKVFSTLKTSVLRDLSKPNRSGPDVMQLWSHVRDIVKEVVQDYNSLSDAVSENLWMLWDVILMLIGAGCDEMSREGAELLLSWLENDEIKEKVAMKFKIPPRIDHIEATFNLHSAVMDYRYVISIEKEVELLITDPDKVNLAFLDVLVEKCNAAALGNRLYLPALPLYKLSRTLRFLWTDKRLRPSLVGLLSLFHKEDPNGFFKSLQRIEIPSEDYISVIVDALVEEFLFSETDMKGGRKRVFNCLVDVLDRNSSQTILKKFPCLWVASAPLQKGTQVCKSSGPPKDMKNMVEMEYEEWVWYACSYVCSLSSPRPELTNIAILLNEKPCRVNLAEKLFPALVTVVYNEQRNIGKLVHLLNSCIAAIQSSTDMSTSRKMTDLILPVLLKYKDAIGIDNLKFSAALTNCGMLYASVLFAELYVDKTLKMEKWTNGMFEHGKRSKLDCLPQPSQETRECIDVLLSTFIEMKNEDEIYGLGSYALVQPSARKFLAEVEGNWNRLLNVACYEGSQSIPLILKNVGMGDIAIQMGGSVAKELQYECAWKLGQWDSLDIPKKAKSFNESMFKSLRLSMDEDSRATAFQSIVTYKAKHAELVDVSKPWGKELSTLLKEAEMMEELRILLHNAVKANTVLVGTQMDTNSQLDVMLNFKDEAVNVGSEMGHVYAAYLRAQLSAQLATPLQSPPEWVLMERLGKLVCQDAAYLRKNNQPRMALEVVHNWEGLLSQLTETQVPNPLILKCHVVEKSHCLWDTEDKFKAHHDLQIQVGDFPNIVCSTKEQKDEKLDLHCKALVLLAKFQKGSEEELSGVSLDRRPIHLLQEAHVQAKLIQDYEKRLKRLGNVSFKLARFVDQLFENVLNYRDSIDYEKKLQTTGKILKEEKKTLSSEQRQRLRSRCQMAEREEKDIASTLRSRLLATVEHYLDCLEYSNEHDLVVFRLIDLWFQYYDKIPELSKTIGERIDGRIPSFKWILPWSQFIGMVGNVKQKGQNQKLFRDTFHRIIERTIQGHPYHCFYALYACSHFDNKDRKSEALEFIRRLLNSEVAGTCRGMVRLADAFRKAIPAQPDHACKNKQKKLGSSHVLMKINKSNLPIPTLPLPIDPSEKYKEFLTIQEVFPTVKGMNSKTVPYLMTCRSSDGRKIKLLLKGNDDLRQDAMIQQVFDFTNRILQDKTRLTSRIRMYNVIPLGPDKGILEWCEGTVSLNEYLTGDDGNRDSGAHKKYGDGTYTAKEASRAVWLLEEKKNGATVKKACATREVLLDVFKKACIKLPPVFRHFFYEHFLDPVVWFEKRNAYTRSVALTSIIGYILGLGDRHMGNILLDEATGEVVHIDFGYMFEFGGFLSMPERVPFRLTRDMIDPMGMAGVGGVFRRTCESTLQAVRDSEKLLLPICNVFIHYPTIAWENKEKDQQDSGKNIYGEDAVERVRDKVLGLGREPGSGNRETTSVTHQVSFLIREATSAENLSSMFSGWQACC